ncbi:MULTISPECIES: hypothetical protein [Rhodopirellula]|uniref:Uncharacterized protein n=1 Tax=Rhodopirellula europaea SH398 TaxID=1263868 RepID=M5RXQ6_9BACT|nr:MULTISPECIES: hypothetical protein [Rhodopirellula]EMI23981.1 hypothetical protein RESH_05437 [Rhodopirellula europaea SH398]
MNRSNARVVSVTVRHWFTRSVKDTHGTNNLCGRWKSLGGMEAG